MRAREMWSTGTPDEPGRYLVAWTHRVLGIDLPRFDYEVHRWDGSEWRTIHTTGHNPTTGGHS
jgi:hypothetical protein